MLVLFVLVFVVAVSFGIAVVAADWPFWQRAWRWHSAGPAGPAEVPGAWARIGTGVGDPWPAVEPDPQISAVLTQLAVETAARALLVVRDGQLLVEHYGKNVDFGTRLQGGALTALVLAPLYGLERQAGADLLDIPLRQLVPGFPDQDVRGDILPRQLLWQVSGLESPAWQPLNPFSAGAQLFFGPNFARAALDARLVWPPGSHFEVSPANAQLLALALQTNRGVSLAHLLDVQLWRPLGAGEALVALDRPGGEMAAHCCLAATGRDWLRLARLFAEDGAVGSRRLLPPGFVAEMAQSTPVHPGYGLGLEVEPDAAGEPLLWGSAPGRLLLAVPARRIAAIWFGPDTTTAQVRAGLASALRLEAPSPQQNPVR
jgi:CubicO group peptidase (beta-lactamase class C family)